MAFTTAYSTSLGTGTTSVTVNAPSGATTGDILVAFIVDKATSGTTGTVAPTGWTFLVAAAGTGGRIQCFYATVGLNGLSGTSWNWTGLTTTSCGTILGATGGYGPSPINGTSTGRINASGTTGTTSITPTQNNSLIIAAFASLSNGATWSGEQVATAPTLTEGFDQANGTSQSIAVATGTLATAAATGASSATMSANTANGGILLALSPDVVGDQITNWTAGAVLGVPLGVDVTNWTSGAVLSVPLGVDITNWCAAAVLMYNNVNPPVWPTVTFNNGVVGVAYSQSWDLYPAAAPTTYTLYSGLLPPGLSIVNTGGASGDVGTISGTPTTIGTYTFQLLATNTYGTAIGPTPTTNFSITITNVGTSWGAVC